MNKITIALREKADGKTYVVKHPNRDYGPDKFVDSYDLAKLEQDCTGWEVQEIDDYIEEESQ